MSTISTTVIEAYEKGYRVVNGAVFSAKGKQRKLKTNGKITKYWFFNIKRKTGAFPVAVHRLLAYQKFGDAAFGVGVHTRHKDNNSLNNSDENIILGTGSENCMDRPVDERKKHAAKGNQKHSPELIEAIRAYHAAGLGYKKLRKKYGLSVSTLCYYLSTTAKRTTYTYQLPV